MSADRAVRESDRAGVVQYRNSETPSVIGIAEEGGAPKRDRLDTPEFSPLFQSLDAAAAWGQTRYRRLVALNLAFIVSGSVLGFAAALSEGRVRSVCIFAAATVLLGSVLTKHWSRAFGTDKRWYYSRAAAETLKSLSWRYMMRVPPFADASADGVFAAALAAVVDETDRPGPANLVAQQAASQITDGMRRVRTSSLDERRELYVAHRLGDQIDWYRRKSDVNRWRAKVWFRVSIAAQVAAIGAAFAAAFTTVGWVNLVGIMGAIAASATAWTQVGQHDQLTKSYALAARELSSIKDLAEHVDAEGGFHEIVRGGEGAISREHTLWVAKRGAPVSASARLHDRR